jgi:hypothetical protein
MTDILAPMDICPAETCYPSSFCSNFVSRFTFEDTQHHIEERTMQTEAMHTITIAEQVPPPPEIIQFASTSTSAASPTRKKVAYGSLGRLCPQCWQDPPLVGQGIIHREPLASGPTKMVTFPGEPASKSDCDSVDSQVDPPVSRYDKKTLAQARAFQPSFKLSNYRLRAK